jgi:hypothetical protein
MTQHPHDRFVDALKPVIPESRQLIRKYFAHLRVEGKESVDWEVRFPGVLAVTYFNGCLITDELYITGDRKLLECAARANIDALMDLHTQTSMQVRNLQATPIVSGGAVLMRGIGVWSLVGGPEVWNHFLTVVGLLRAEFILQPYALQLLRYTARGIEEACKDAGMTEDVYTEIWNEVWALREV